MLPVVNFMLIRVAPGAKSPATREASRVVNALRERQVLCSTTGEHANTLKIRPPLVFRSEHADLLVSTLDDVLHTLMT